jgi:hypothetical protein
MVGNRRVFDGMHVFVSAVISPIVSGPSFTPGNSGLAKVGRPLLLDSGPLRKRNGNVRATPARRSRSATVAEVYWELGHDADLPLFVDADGKKRYVEGAGFAIVRDAADFLAHAPADTAGTPNPLNGAINRTLATFRRLRPTPWHFDAGSGRHINSGRLG